MAIGSFVTNLTCFWHGQNFLPTADVTACLKSLPFNPAWRDGTVQTLQKLLPNYVLRDSLTDTGPPANIQVDLMAELEQIATTEFATDMEMQSTFAKLFLGAHDAHTKYEKCDAYRNLYYTQPFGLRVAAVGEAQRIYFDGEARPGLLDYLGMTQDLDGLEILSIDGVAPITAITHWADEFVGRSQDQSTRFNIALFKRFFTTRLLSYHDLPEGNIDYVLRDATGETVTASLPWTAMPEKPLSDVNISVEACTFASKDLLAVSHSRSRGAAYGEDYVERVPLQSAEPTSWSTELSEPPLSLHISEDGRVAVLKLASFSPGNVTAHCGNVQRSFAILAKRGVKNLIVDVLKNGGGNVCMGYNLLRMLAPDDLLDAPPSVYEGAYDMPWSAAISAAVSSSKEARDALGLDSYIDAETGKHIKEEEMASFYDGGRTYIRGHVAKSRRTKKFYLDCDTSSGSDDMCDLSAPPIVFPKERILILSDGYCGSTCATFMHRLQAGSYGVIAGVGGIKHMTMSTSSFAGGFVGRIADINDVLGHSQERIPNYPTNGGVPRLAWGEVYDYGRKETPAQYAWSPPDIRLDFWDFNGDLGPLYDMARATFAGEGAVFV